MREDTLPKVLDIGIAFSKEKDKEQLLDQILTAALELTHCDGGTLYINQGDSLEFRIMITTSQGIHKGGRHEPVDMPPVPMSEKNVCACGVLYRRLINIPDVYESTHYDFSGPKKYDAITGYKTKSMMVVPMEDDHENVIGVMQLINALDEDGNVIPFEKDYERILLSLGSQAAICLVNMNYSEQIRNMLDSFVKVMSTAIDARTPYNANHTRNMVIYASNFIDWLNAKQTDWKFEEEKKRIFLLSIWLHDIGKLVTPRKIMDKQDRLGVNLKYMEDRLEKISLLVRLAYLEGRMEQGVQVRKLQQIERSRKLIHEINAAGVLSEEQEQAVEELSQLTYEEEDGRVLPWITDEEKKQLLIKKGTLTAEEREIMQNHVVMTRKLLEQMNFTDQYKNVLTWASSHHELLNGTGYPEKLEGDELPKEVRLLTILDIFEALTARDRPYKQPMPVEKAMGILHGMAQAGELDAGILALFEESQAWTAEE